MLLLTTPFLGTPLVPSRKTASPRRPRPSGALAQVSENILTINGGQRVRSLRAAEPF